MIGGFLVLAAAQIPSELEVAQAVWEAHREPDAKLLEPLRDATTPAPRRLRARRFLEAAVLAERAGKHDSSLRWLRSAASLAPDDATVLSRYAGALGASGRPRGAERAWRDVLALPDLSADQRDVAERALVALKYARP